jgi:hypothetical protein
MPMYIIVYQVQFIIEPLLVVGEAVLVRQPTALQLMPPDADSVHLADGASRLWGQCRWFAAPGQWRNHGCSRRWWAASF